MTWLNVAEKAETEGFDVAALWDERDGVDVITRISITPTPENVGADGMAYLHAAQRVLRAYGGDEASINFCEPGEADHETVFFVAEGRIP